MNTDATKDLPDRAFALKDWEDSRARWRDTALRRPSRRRISSPDDFTPNSFGCRRRDEIRGRAAIVTGGADGLAIARRLAAERDGCGLGHQQRGRAARFLGDAHVGCAVDHDEAGVERHEVTWRAFGRVDLLVNDAGVPRTVAPLWEQQGGDFAALDVNLIGTFWSAGPSCRACASSSPIGAASSNISSIQAKEGLAMSSAYARRKRIIALTRTRQRAGARGHLVNPLHARSGGDGHDGADRRAAPRRHSVPHPMSGFVEPEEIAR